jgi:ankyrin repeat protein
MKEHAKEKVKEWINYRSVENYEETALQLAVRMGNLSIIKLLEKHGADMNCITKDGRTIAHLCAKYDKIVPLAYLRQKGFNINSQDSKMVSPFHIAIEDNRPCSLKFMSNWIDVDFNI